MPGLHILQSERSLTLNPNAPPLHFRLRVRTMLSIAATATAAPFSSSFKLLRRNPNRSVSTVLCASAAAPGSTEDRNLQPIGSNHAGVRLEDSIDIGLERMRLDLWIFSRIQGVSRARIQYSIRSGLVTVNGRTVDKVSHIIKAGDRISCTVSELQPLRAEPEDIPVDIVYEDAHILVVNKPAHMVVHPAPGNANGTLVDARLNHCRLPIAACINNERSFETEEYSDSDESEDVHVDHCFEDCKSENSASLVRPGIVHRLDKGTSGLLVVAKI